MKSIQMHRASAGSAACTHTRVRLNASTLSRTNTHNISHATPRAHRTQAQKQDTAVSAESLMDDVNAMMAKLEKAGGAQQAAQQDDGGGGDIFSSRDEDIVCDEAGCVVISGDAEDDVESTPSLLLTVISGLSGSGWKLGMRGSDVGAPKSHPGLIGNKDCCVSITTTELDDVVMAFKAIRKNIKETAARMEGNARGKPLKVLWDTPAGVKLEAVCASVPPVPEEFDVTIRLEGARPLSVKWSKSAVAEMFKELNALTPQ